MGQMKLKNGHTVIVAGRGSKNIGLSESDREMDKRAKASVKAAIKKAQICNKPVARYDKEKHKAYLEYVGGERKYE